MFTMCICDLVRDFKVIGARIRKLRSENEAKVFCHKFWENLDGFLQTTETDVGDRISGLELAVQQFTNHREFLSQCDEVHELFQVIFLTCARVILSMDWQNLVDDDCAKESFIATLERCEPTLVHYNHTQIEVLNQLVRVQWTEPVLAEIMSCDETDSEKEEVSKYLFEQHPDILRLRLSLLIDNGCDEFALNMAKWLTRMDVFSQDVDILQKYLLLLIRLDKRDQFHKKCSKVQCHTAVEIIDCVRKLPGQEETALIMAQTFLGQDLFKPTYYCCTKKLLSMWMELQYKKDCDHNAFCDSVQKMTMLCKDSVQLTYFAETLHSIYEDEFLSICVRLLVKAFKSDAIMFACHKRGVKDINLVSMTASLIHVCNLLSGMLRKHSSLISQLSLLTAFSLDPSEELYSFVELLYCVINASKKEKESEANDNSTDKSNDEAVDANVESVNSGEEVHNEMEVEDACSGTEIFAKDQSETLASNHTEIVTMVNVTNARPNGSPSCESSLGVDGEANMAEANMAEAKPAMDEECTDTNVPQDDAIKLEAQTSVVKDDDLNSDINMNPTASESSPDQNQTHVNMDVDASSPDDTPKLVKTEANGPFSVRIDEIIKEELIDISKVNGESSTTCTESLLVGDDKKVDDTGAVTDALSANSPTNDSQSETESSTTAARAATFSECYENFLRQSSTAELDSAPNTPDGDDIASVNSSMNGVQQKVVEVMTEEVVETGAVGKGNESQLDISDCSTEIGSIQDPESPPKEDSVRNAVERETSPPSKRRRRSDTAESGTDPHPKIELNKYGIQIPGVEDAIVNELISTLEYLRDHELDPTLDWDILKPICEDRIWRRNNLPVEEISSDKEEENREEAVEICDEAVVPKVETYVEIMTNDEIIPQSDTEGLVPLSGELSERDGALTQYVNELPVISDSDLQEHLTSAAVVARTLTVGNLVPRTEIVSSAGALSQTLAVLPRARPEPARVRPPGPRCRVITSGAPVGSQTPVRWPGKKDTASRPRILSQNNSPVAPSIARIQIRPPVYPATKTVKHFADPEPPPSMPPPPSSFQSKRPQTQRNQMVAEGSPTYVIVKSPVNLDNQVCQLTKVNGQVYKIWQSKNKSKYNLTAGQRIIGIKPLFVKPGSEDQPGGNSNEQMDNQTIEQVLRSLINRPKTVDITSLSDLVSGNYDNMQKPSSAAATTASAALYESGTLCAVQNLTNVANNSHIGTIANISEDRCLAVADQTVVSSGESDVAQYFPVQDLTAAGNLTCASAFVRANSMLIAGSEKTYYVPTSQNVIITLERSDTLPAFIEASSQGSISVRNDQAMDVHSSESVTKLPVTIAQSSGNSMAPVQAVVPLLDQVGQERVQHQYQTLASGSVHGKTASAHNASLATMSVADSTVPNPGSVARQGVVTTAPLVAKAPSNRTVGSHVPNLVSTNKRTYRVTNKKPELSRNAGVNYQLIEQNQAETEKIRQQCLIQNKMFDNSDTFARPSVCQIVDHGQQRYIAMKPVSGPAAVVASPPAVVRFDQAVTASRSVSIAPAQNMPHLNGSSQQVQAQVTRSVVYPAAAVMVHSTPGNRTQNTAEKGGPLTKEVLEQLKTLGVQASQAKVVNMPRRTLLNKVKASGAVPVQVDTSHLSAESLDIRNKLMATWQSPPRVDEPKKNEREPVLALLTKRLNDTISQHPSGPPIATYSRHYTKRKSVETVLNNRPSALEGPQALNSTACPVKPQPFLGAGSDANSIPTNVARKSVPGDGRPPCFNHYKS